MSAATTVDTGPSPRLQRTRSLLIDPVAEEAIDASLCSPHGVHIVVVVCGIQPQARKVACKLVRYLTWIGHRSCLFTTATTLSSCTPSSCDMQHRDRRAAFNACIDYTNQGGISVLDADDVGPEDVAPFQSNARRVQLIWCLVGSELQLSLDKNAAWIRLVYDPEFSVTRSSVRGNVARIVFRYLAHLALHERPLMASRHGESADNLQGYIGGDSRLTDRGNHFAVALGRFVDDRQMNGLQVWTSNLQRTVMTAAFITSAVTKRTWECLQEIDAGVFTGLTYEEIERTDPVSFNARKRDKLRYQYPEGESYVDVIERLDPIVLEVERANYPIVIISHKAVLRCLLGYFLNSHRTVIPDMTFPSHSVVSVRTGSRGIIVDTYEMGIAHVENQPKPAAVSQNKSPFEEEFGADDGDSQIEAFSKIDLS